MLRAGPPQMLLLQVPGVTPGSSRTNPITTLPGEKQAAPPSQPPRAACWDRAGSETRFERFVHSEMFKNNPGDGWLLPRRFNPRAL